jgi:hypothetical protein
MPMALVNIGAVVVVVAVVVAPFLWGLMVER